MAAKKATGLECSRYGTLNVNTIEHPSRLRLNFWPLLEELPLGSLLVFSGLQDEREARSLHLGPLLQMEDLRSHPCMGSTPSGDQLNLAHQIIRRVATIGRHHAGFVSGHPNALGIRLGRYGWPP